MTRTMSAIVPLLLEMPLLRSLMLPPFQFPHRRAASVCRPARCGAEAAPARIDVERILPGGGRDATPDDEEPDSRDRNKERDVPIEIDRAGVQRLLAEGAQL